jgi:hypothetical protein
MSLFSPSKIALLTIACAPLALPAQATKGGATPAAAVEEFMRALADSNLTRMSELFGNAKGPVIKTKPKDYQKKVLIMQLFLRGIQVQTLGDVPGKDGMRTVTTLLTNHGCRVTIPVDAVKAPEGWLVNNFKLEDAAEVNKPCDRSGRPTGNPGR